VTVPKWDDPHLKAGTMVRGALWLVSKIGEGNIFTKEQVRQVFPGVTQADRRIRDLRKFGWIIYSSNDDATLKSDEQRFVRMGLEVWNPEIRRTAASKAISAKDRQEVMAADAYQCVVCGIAGGEIYLDSPNVTAVLSVTRRTVRSSDGHTEDQLVTECKHCRAGTDPANFADVGRLIAEIRSLDGVDRARLLRWMERGRRSPTPIDRAWTRYRQLPIATRDKVLRHLQGGLPS
jgi:hypothetical protein